MSFSIRSITPSDGRLGSRRSEAELSKGGSSETDAFSTQEDHTGFFLSTYQATSTRRNNQLLRNANNAISLIQVAEDALDATAIALHKMRLLSVQTPDNQDIHTGQWDLSVETAGLTDEICQIFDKTTFDNQSLLNGSVDNQAYPVGDNPDQTIPITIRNMGTVLLELREKMGAVVVSKEAEHDFQAVYTAQATIIDNAIRSVSQVRTTLDSLQNRFEEAIVHLKQATDNTAGRTHPIEDANFAAETALFTRNVILQETELSIITQANQQPRIAMQLLE